MTYYDDVQAAQAKVDSLTTQLADAQSALKTLLAAAVVGGPDVSSTQGDVDWTKVAGAGYDVCFPKVSDGDLNDPTYSIARVASIRSAGLSFAPYYYARIAASGNNFRTPKSEAAMAYYFASRMGWGKAGDLPLVYDVEKSSTDTASTFQGQSATAAATHVTGFVKAYRALAGHYPFIYTNPDTWTLLGPFVDATVLSKCPLWLAHYGVTTPAVPATWTSWTFWQYTDKATVAGISVPVDLSRCAISKTDLDALRIT